MNTLFVNLGEFILNVPELNSRKNIRKGKSEGCEILERATKMHSRIVWEIGNVFLYLFIFCSSCNGCFHFHGDNMFLCNITRDGALQALKALKSHKDTLTAIYRSMLYITHMRKVKRNKQFENSFFLSRFYEIAHAINTRRLIEW